MTWQMSLFFGSIAFVGSHFLMSHPLRAPLVRTMGEGPFRGLYSLVSLILFGLMIFSYHRLGREEMLWQPSEAMWIAGAILMWIGSILFVGSFVGNPALPGAPRPRGNAPAGVLAITRHPMMWGFALWGIVHLMLVAMMKAIVFDAAIIILALVGSVLQDRKKQALMGQDWHDWTARTAFVPFTRGLANPGAIALVGGTLLFLVATWFHPMPTGLWRWID